MTEETRKQLDKIYDKMWMAKLSYAEGLKKAYELGEKAGRSAQKEEK